MKVLTIFLTNLFAWMPATVWAAGADPGDVRQLVDTSANLVRYFLDWLPKIGGAIVVLMIIWGGIQYITRDAEGGKKTIGAAIVGAIIIMLAYVIITAFNAVLTTGS